MKIWSQTLVKNEERFIWYALQSVVDYVDKMLVWDTGSTDNTPSIVKLFQQRYPSKVEFRQYNVQSKDEVTQLRQKMLEHTHSDWFIVLDGDEVWWEQSIEAVATTLHKQGTQLESIVVPFINLIGDIYHYQTSSAGNYRIDDKKGHITIRAINRSIPGLRVDKPYPLEGYFDNVDTPIQQREKEKRLYIDAPYLHFSHLVRSSTLASDAKTIARSGKRKVELGKQFPLDYYYPESFFRTRPEMVANVWQKMDMSYYLKALVISPARKAKRLLTNG